MATPADQTLTLIVTEALMMAGYPNPGATLVTRASDEWLRRTLQRIAKKTTLLLYEQTEVTLLDSYVSRIALPTNCDTISQITAYTGQNTGALQAATGSSVTLASDEDMTEEFAKGKLLFITSGSAIRLVVRITSFNESTKLAGIAPNFSITPSASDTYLVADSEQVLQLKFMNNIPDNPSIGLPTSYHVFGRTPVKELILDKALSDEDVGALKMRYNVSPNFVDLTDARMTSIYNNLQSELTQGVLALAYEDKNDSRYTTAINIFDDMIKDYISKQNVEAYQGFEMFGD